MPPRSAPLRCCCRCCLQASGDVLSGDGAGSVWDGLLQPCRLMPPDLMLAPTVQCPSCGEGEALQLLVCHGVDAVGWWVRSPEGGDLGDRFLMPAVSVGTCQPGCLYGDGEVLPHGLGRGLGLAPCPYDLAGLEAGGGGHDHGLGLSVELREV